MCGLPSLRPREVIRALERGGYYVHHTTGSHRAMRHPDKPHVRVTIPYHNRDLKPGTLHDIIRQAGLSPQDLLNLL